MMNQFFKLRGIDTVFFFSHLLFLLFSYSIYLAPHIAPSTFPYFGFVPIVYPLIILCNIFLIVLLLVRKWRYGVLFLICSLGLYPPLTNIYQYFGKENHQETDLKILSFNAQYLKKEGVADFFNQQKADIILLQEVYWRDSKFKNLNEAALSKYYHEKHGLIQVFSKYPIIEFKQILSPNDKTVATAAYADIDIGEDTIRIINVYLETMLIPKKLVSETIHNHEKTEENTMILKNKLTTGFLHHEIQIKELVPFIVNSKHPVILAGDLNSVPNSYEYQQLTYRLEDAYPAVGKSSGTSFHDFKYPLRLDYVFHSKELIPTKYEVLKNIHLSDHYPVIAYFKFP